MPDYQHVLLEKDSVEHIAKLTLNRPDRLNALNDLMIDEIGDAVENVSGDDSMRVLILTGAGRAFCSGGDLQTLIGGNEPGSLCRTTPMTFAGDLNTFKSSFWESIGWKNR